MRDYLRKQNKEAMTGVPEVVTSVILQEPSRYKGRFKLNTWSHKAKLKATTARKARSRGVGGQAPTQEAALHSEVAVSVWQPISPLLLPKQVFSVSGRLDPFDSLAIQLGPKDDKLLVHCQFPTIPNFPLRISTCGIHSCLNHYDDTPSARGLLVWL